MLSHCTGTKHVPPKTQSQHDIIPDKTLSVLELVACSEAMTFGAETHGAKFSEVKHAQKRELSEATKTCT